MSQEPLIGSISMFAGPFAPRGWAFCDGQVLSIMQHTALYSILGTMYGGDARATFQLPDLRDRFPTHVGAGAGLETIAPGQSGGSKTATLEVRHMPAHTHDLETGVVGDGEPRGDALLGGGAAEYSSAQPTAAMNAGTVLPNGRGWPIASLNRHVTLNFIIALRGTFPARS